MKKIEAYIQTFMLEKVVDSLVGAGIRGATVVDTKGFGHGKDESYPHHSTDYSDFTPKTKIEIVCSDSECERLIETIRKAAHTGRKGDGKIFVYEVSKAVSIFNGKQGEEAI